MLLQAYLAYYIMPPMFTGSKARLHFIKKAPGPDYNWLFLPGGPGLGSESLNELIALLKPPGSVWQLDLPGDGSNTTGDFAHWSNALIEAVSALPHVILVAHSSGGMFALATPELEKHLIGLVIMDSAPDASWQQSFAELVKNNPLPEAEKLQAQYDLNPSNALLKQLTIACAPYFATEKSLDQITQLIQHLPFNYKAHLWAAKHFDPTYRAKWVPQTLPTLLFAGDQDHLTPLSLFLERKDFHRANVVIRKIAGGSHFPWIDNPGGVIGVFEEFYPRLPAL